MPGEGERVEHSSWQRTNSNQCTAEVSIPSARGEGESGCNVRIPSGFPNKQVCSPARAREENIAVVLSSAAEVNAILVSVHSARQTLAMNLNLANNTTAVLRQEGRKAVERQNY